MKSPGSTIIGSVLAFQDITLEAVLAGKVGMEDLRVTSEALEMQAQVAEAVGRPQLAENLRRAAELVNVPEERILEIYNALRPGRTDPRALFELALPMSMRPRGRAPAMLVLGTERDALFTPAHIAASAARFDLTPVMLPHLSHMFMLEPGWESAAAHLADWLDAQLAPGNPA